MGYRGGANLVHIVSVDRLNYYPPKPSPIGKPEFIDRHSTILRTLSKDPQDNYLGLAM